MNVLHITDLGDGHVQVRWRCGKAGERYSHHPIAFASPLRGKDRKELRWYLEEYLQFPFGAEEYRAQQAEQRMAELGESLFSQVFTASEDVRTYYQEAVREGLERCDLCVSSEEPDFLNIPWELIRDPIAGRGYLAPSLGGLYRQHTAHKVETFPERSPEEPFRVLLVITRPYGDRDIPLGTVARPILEALRPLRPRIQLEVLRPPTFDALQKRLNAQRGFYHLVHFDGHGVFARSSGGRLMQFGGRADKGHLVFEKDDGTEDIVNSEDLGQALATCKVPLFVLNACQSAEEGKRDPFSSVASQLVAIGARGVVAMSYSVYATAAARFMQRFYESLVDHVSLAEAVAAARRRLYADPGRESVIGPIELRDWMVPVLYQQEYGYVPIPQGASTVAAEEDILRQRAEEVCPEGRFGFVGRDNDILRIERALRDDGSLCALLTGLGGAGKTELAFGFARWYAETGGCPGGVFVTSFKEKADFGQVIGSIVGHGTDFSRLPEQEQWRRLIGYLRENPCLLIWDNFETVTGYPIGAVPLASGEEQAILSRFLKALKGGKSRVLITSRKPDEDWLGIACEPIEVAGLIGRDAGQLAKAILRTAGRRPEDFRNDPEYARLIKLLRGHPRSMEVVLPHLRTRTSADIIQALQHRVDSLGELLEDASLGYAFSQMSPRTRRHLPFIGLFVSYVHAGTVAVFVGAGDERQRVYEDIVGEALDAKGWEAVLEEAGRSGLLRPINNALYELHPTLAPFLRRQLVAAAGEDGLRRLDAEFMGYYAAWAILFFDDVRKGDKNALTAVTVQEGNLLRALRLAESSEQWLIGQAILQALGEFYEIRGRRDEWAALRSGLLGRIGRDLSTEADRAQADLQIYLLGSEANAALDRNELSTTEAAHQSILHYLISLNDPAVEPKIAVVYHQLGLVVHQRQQFDQAEELYRKALQIFERLGLEQYAAADYHQLGIIAEERQQFDEAEQWYLKALEIYERLGLERDAADEHHQLGMIAEERQQLDRAEQWYRKALEINERLGLEPDAASDYHQLGIIAEERRQFDRAEQWYRKALEIYERLGLEWDAADEYHQLGIIAHKRQQLDQAEQWSRKALEINERLGLERDAASDYHQLGMIAEERQQLDRAEQWYLKALEIYERLGLERDATDDYHHMGSIAQKRHQFDQAEQWYRKALEIYERLGHPPLLVNTLAQLGVLYQQQNQLSKAVLPFGRAYAIAAQYEMRVGEKILISLAYVMRAMGEKKFTSAWRQAVDGQEPPLAALRGIVARLPEEEAT